MLGLEFSKKLTRNQLAILIKEAKGGSRLTTNSELQVSQLVADKLGVEVCQKLKDTIHREIIYC